MPNINDQIKILIDLQKIDSEIYTLLAEEKRIPQIVQELENNFNAKKELLKSLEEKSKTVQLKRKEKELDLSSKEEAIKKSQNQLYTLKTNKEYQAKLSEIEGIKASCSLLEEEIIKILEGLDSLAQETNRERENLANEEKKFKEEKNKYENRLKEIADRLKVLEAQRKNISQGVEPKILSQYERVLKNREGLGIVFIKDNACQGCFMEVAPQLINEIKMNKTIITCPACQRILYLEEQ